MIALFLQKKRIFLGICFLLGCLTSFSLAPFYLWPIWLLSFPVILKLLENSNFKASLAIGWSFGFGYFTVSLYWIGIAFLVDAETYAWLMPFAIIGLPAFLALYWAIGFAVANYFRLAGNFKILIFATCLTLCEFLRGHLFTGFPWNAPGYVIFASDELAQISSYIGLWGISFLVFISAGLPTLLIEKKYKSFAIWLTGFGALFLLGYWNLNSSIPLKQSVSVRLVQPSVPQSDKWRYDNAREIFRDLLALTAGDGIADKDLVLWPESAFPGLIEEDPAARNGMARLLPPKASLITGSLRREIIGEVGGDDDLIFNSIISINATGEVTSHYDKFHLVPGGEYLPLEKWLNLIGIRRLVSLPGSFQAGSGPQTISLAHIPPFSPLICYEIIFPNEVVADQRPKFIVNLTNDGWFGDSTGPWQHLDQARMRAIEEGLPVLRAANTGISAIIDAHGRVLASSQMNQRQIIDSTLPPALEATLYSKFGDWPILALILVLFCISFWRKTTIYARINK